MFNKRGMVLTGSAQAERVRRRYVAVVEGYVGNGGRRESPAARCRQLSHRLAGVRASETDGCVPEGRAEQGRIDAGHDGGGRQDTGPVDGRLVSRLCIHGAGLLMPSAGFRVGTSVDRAYGHRVKVAGETGKT